MFIEENMHKERFEQWFNSDKLNDTEKKELKSISDDQSEILFRFGKDLEFGTAGMRGIIGLGTNMINVHVVKRATQALSEYIKTLGKKAMKRGVAISYDTRKYSFEFAYASAIVLVSNGINAHLFLDVHPVPMLSYAVRKLNAIAGIMITASHNPKEYNGYKVYGEDGAQMSPLATEKVVRFIDEIGDPLSDKILYNENKQKKIRFIKKSLDKSFYKEIKKLCLSREAVKIIGEQVKLVYTPVHGSGLIPVTTIFKKIGINAMVVPEQQSKDCEFSTVNVPNPEYQETLTLGIKMADFKNADVVIGTDPDCDRMGVAIRNDKGEFITLSGNQTGILLLDYVLSRLEKKNKLDKNCFVAKSFVSTSMAKLIADDYGVELMETPVGFKFIGEKIKEFDDTGKKKFVFGFEESCGFLRGTHARDKDAVVASMLFAEMVCYYTYKKVSIYSRLQEIYQKYGYVYDVNVSTVYHGLNAMKDMNATVDRLKNKAVTEIGGAKVEAVRDYLTLKRKLTDGGEEDIDSTSNNALYYELENGFVCVRPSGTEPKLKIYYSVKDKTEQDAIKAFEKIKEDFESNVMR